jgi:hypothetical protein
VKKKKQNGFDNKKGDVDIQREKKNRLHAMKKHLKGISKCNRQSSGIV